MHFVRGENVVVTKSENAVHNLGRRSTHTITPNAKIIRPTTHWQLVRVVQPYFLNYTGTTSYTTLANHLIYYLT